MKRQIGIIILAMIIAILLVGCGSQEVTTEATTETHKATIGSIETESTETTEATTETEPTAEFMELPMEREDDVDDEQLSSIYVEEVKARLSTCDEEDFITRDEKEVYVAARCYVDKYGPRVSRPVDEDTHYWEVGGWAYYPVIFEHEGSLIMVYTTERGAMKIASLSGEASPWFYSSDTIHMSESLEWGLDESLFCTRQYALVRRGGTKVQKWAFGDLLAECELPAEAVYTGRSVNEGLIFRSGEELYAVREETLELIKLLEGVKWVVSAHYDWAGDFCGYPLIQLQDGTLKVLISYQDLDGELVVTLYDLEVEGGFYRE